ncbi:MAG: hypothetical protein J5509_03910 [Lachnospiraceae bacterium]|nr:hypothetical protein [Lachnospiraceae bacterium]
MTDPRLKKYISAFLFAFITVVGVSVKLYPLSGTEPIAWERFNIMPPVVRWILFALLLMYEISPFKERIACRTARERVCVIVPALLFSVFILIGYSFDHSDSFQYLYIPGPYGFQMILKDLLFFAAFFLLLTRMIELLYYLMDRIRDLFSETLQTGRTVSRIFRMYESHPVLTVFVIMSIFYIPYMILYYPGLFMGDSYGQVLQPFKGTLLDLGHTMIDENVKLNGHHPIVHTLLIHMFIMIGKTVFRSYDFGVFLYTIAQVLFFMLCISYSIVHVSGMRRDRTFIILTLYFMLHPVVTMLSNVMTKDIIYVSLLSVFIVSVYEISTDISSPWLLLILSAAGIVLIRNEGVYIMVLSGIVMMALLRKNLIKWIGLIASCIVIYVLLHGVFMPVLKVTPGDAREYFNIPFQQVARYVTYCGDMVTEEEKEGIDALIDYDSIAESYVSVRSDNIKNLYNMDADSNDIKTFLKTWKRIYKKVPLVYVESVISNYYRYLYPGGKRIDLEYGTEQSYTMMELTNAYSGQAMTDFGTSGFCKMMKPVMEGYEYIRDFIADIPILNIVLYSATYLWGFILLIMYSIRVKSMDIIPALVPMIFVVLTYFVGATNGEYPRYIYYMIVVMPLLFVAYINTPYLKPNRSL